MTRLAIVGLAWTVACGTAEASRENGHAHLDSVTAALVGEDDQSSSALGSASPKQDRGLLRSYFAGDMKFHSCVSRHDDARIVGEHCPSTIVLFGPYITVPANSDVRLRFDIEARGPLTLTSDVISRDTKQFHGAIEEQRLNANERRTVGYRIHVFDPTPTLETRVGIRASAPVDFEITNLAINVQ